MQFIVKFFQESLDNFPRSSWPSKSQFQNLKQLSMLGEVSSYSSKSIHVVYQILRPCFWSYGFDQQCEKNQKEDQYLKRKDERNVRLNDIDITCSIDVIVGWHKFKPWLTNNSVDVNRAIIYGQIGRHKHGVRPVVKRIQTAFFFETFR